MPFNVSKSLKNMILRFGREYYDSNLQYADPLIEKWVKSYVVFIIDTVCNGAVLYLVLVGLKIVFPFNLFFINTGTSLWHIPIIIGVLGLILWYFQKFYEYIRGGYRKK